MNNKQGTGQARPLKLEEGSPCALPEGFESFRDGELRSLILEQSPTNAIHHPKNFIEQLLEDGDASDAAKLLAVLGHALSNRLMSQNHFKQLSGTTQPKICEFRAGSVRLFGIQMSHAGKEAFVFTYANRKVSQKIPARVLKEIRAESERIYKKWKGARSNLS